MTTTAGRMRAWQGPTLLSHGFRPFFLGAGIWAVLAMALWLAMLGGWLTLDTAFDPTSWHAHAFLFGYLGAVLAGFLLTAVPNWTGRMPVVGWSLVLPVGLWALGRVVVLVPSGLSPLHVALVDLAFPTVLAGIVGREIVRGRNWRNLVVLALLVVFTLGNAVFHLEAARGDFAAQGFGLRIGLGTAIMMIAVVGGRVVPSFTRNWLIKRGATDLPAPPMQRFDKLALLLLLVALVAWVARPDAATTGGLLLAAGLAHLLRLARWAGHRSGAEPLVWVLHAGYAFLPIGAIALGLAALLPGGPGMAAAQHLWMAGAIGLMTLAVMTRATLGHAGQALTAGPATQGIYLLTILSVLARVAAGFAPAEASWLHDLAGGAWLAAFGGFVIIYGRHHLVSRPPV